MASKNAKGIAYAKAIEATKGSKTKKANKARRLAWETFSQEPKEKNK